MHKRTFACGLAGHGCARTPNSCRRLFDGLDGGVQASPVSFSNEGGNRRPPSLSQNSGFSIGSIGDERERSDFPSMDAREMKSVKA